MPGYECIYTARVRVEELAVVVAQRSYEALGVGANAKDALHPVMFEEFRSEKFGYFTRSHAAGHVHLPQAVLRRNVTLRLEQVVKICGFDVRNSMAVAADCDRSGETRQMNLAIQLRKRDAHGVLEPPSAGQGSDSNQEDEDYQDAQDYAQDGTPAPFLDFNTSPESHLGVIVSLELLSVLSPQLSVGTSLQRKIEMATSD